MTEEIPEYRLVDSASPSFVIFTLPSDERLLAAIGAVALRHAQLDHILRMTIKSITGITVAEAWDSLARVQSRELRRRAAKLASAQIGDGAVLLKLQALLERCSRATDRRNELIHQPFASVLDGEHVVKTSDHQWRPVPTVAALNELADLILSLLNELNAARLSGSFLHDALKNGKPPR